jgi:poly-beta-1,6-N-acetyl-D-glucosamine synthase
MHDETYALITPARNEDAYIQKTLESVVAQTHPPKTWVVVSDGSTDRTDDIVREFARRYAYIQLLRLDQAGPRTFARQALASNIGYKRIKHLSFDYVGLLDADISFAPTYYETLLARLRTDTLLGITGGDIHELSGDDFEARLGNSADCVAGAIQLFRRACFDEIGGFVPLRHGGHDAVAITMATKMGWRVQSFTDLPVFHHRPTGREGVTARRARFREGVQDYALGYHALFEAAKCIRRAGYPPRVLGSALHFIGYIWASLTRQKEHLPKDYVRYLRSKQVQRLYQSVLGR